MLKIELGVFDMRKSTQVIRNFILENLDEHPGDIAVFTAKHFSLSVQAINRYLRILQDENLIIAEGKTKARKYTLKSTREIYNYKITPDLKEHVVLINDISKHWANLPDNVSKIWDYCFAEIFNNAIEHSEGKNIIVEITQNTINTSVLISDDGIGIFNKVRKFLNLQDNREVAIELAKGKMTTDRNQHSGQGIFFTSRAVDRFIILSYGISWVHDHDKADIFEENNETEFKGTAVRMILSNKTTRTISSVFDEYGKEKFNTTIIPVILMTSNGEGLVSRSQARRVLARLDSFEKVFLDFNGVKDIGQAFADEIFRVFPLMHPDANISYINAAPAVERMITRAKNDASD